MKVIKNILLTISLIVGIFVFFVALNVFSPYIYNYLNRSDFDRNEWINWQYTEATASLRWNMVHDLTSNHELIGTNRAELIELLGVPDYEFKNEVGYSLGMSGHGINTGTLTVTFKNDKVVDFKVTQG